MPSYVKEAHVFTDNRTNKKCVEFKYTRYVEGDGYRNYAASFAASPIGGWSDINSSHESIRYELFLDTMVEKTLTTRRVMALTQLENVMCENVNTQSHSRIMNSVKILDPTFIPPIINMQCSWQKKLVRSMCHITLPYVIENCTNEKRLDTFFIVMRLIESETQ
jgi:hypothetical protein